MNVVNENDIDFGKRHKGSTTFRVHLIVSVYPRLDLTGTFPLFVLGIDLDLDLDVIINIFIFNLKAAADGSMQPSEDIGRQYT